MQQKITLIKWFALAGMFSWSSFTWAFADVGDAIAIDQHVEHSVPAVGRIDNPPTLQ